MYLALAIGTCLLGSWTLEPPSEEYLKAGPAVRAPLVSPLTITPQGTNITNPSREKPTSPFEGRRSGALSEGGDAARGRTAGAPQTPTDPTQRAAGAAGMGSMPSSPTDPTAAEGGALQPAAPTEGGASIEPMAPTGGSFRRPAASMSGGRGGNLGMSQPMTSPYGMGSAGRVAPTAPRKAFSDYRPSSGVSPWMNLFRRDSLGTVDNYTTLVRPQLDQQHMNRQVRGELRGLEQNSAMQNATMQQFEQSRALQGVATPQFYMNYGSYYPFQRQVPPNAYPSP